MPVQTNNRATPRADLRAALIEYPFMAPGMIGLQILRRLDVMKKKGAFSALTREGITRRRDVRRQSRSNYSRDTFEQADITYDCLEYGHEAPLDDGDRQLYATDFDAEKASAAYAQSVILREQEIRIKTKIFDVSATGWYSSTAALYTDWGSSAPWDAAASDVIAHIEAGKNKVRTNCGLSPNTMVIGAVPFGWLKMNTVIRALFPGAVAITEQLLLGMLPTIFGIPNILIGGAAYNSAAEGLDATMADVWGDDYCWLGVCAQTDSPIEPCVGRTMLWVEDTPENVMFEEYREEQTYSNIYRARQHTDEKVFDVYFGHLLKIDA